MEYKFRGKGEIDGIWVYGNLFKNECCTRIIPKTTIIMNDDRILGVTLVDPKTVGQFLLIQDKNGIDAYDGDRYINHENGLKGVLRIEESIGGIIVYATEIKDGETYTYRPFHELDLTDFEIIGNIHDSNRIMKK